MEYSKLKESDVLLIYDLIDKDMNNRHIANRIGAHESNIRSIRFGQTWKRLFKERYPNGVKRSFMQGVSVSKEKAFGILEDIERGVLSLTRIGRKHHYEVANLSRIKKKGAWKGVWAAYLLLNNK